MIEASRLKSYFYDTDGNYIDFCLKGEDEGELHTSGTFKLDEEQAKKLFMAMMVFYKAKNDRFWEEE